MGFKSPPKSAEAKAEWLKWFENPNGETQQQLSKRIGTSETTLIIWKKAKIGSAKTKEQLGEETFLELVKAAKRGNAAAGRTVLQALGMLIEKQEDKHPTDFTPEQYIEISIRIINKIKQLYKDNGGCCPICGKSSLLSTEVRLSTEQEHGTDSQVGSMGLS